MGYTAVISSHWAAIVVAIIVGLAGFIAGYNVFDRDSKKKTQDFAVWVILAACAVFAAGWFDYTVFGPMVVQYATAMLTTALLLGAIGFIARPIIDAIEDWRIPVVAIAVVFVIVYLVMSGSVQIPVAQ